MRVETFSIGSRYYPNEDSLCTRSLGVHGIAAVLADGMGGLSLGAIAADEVTKSIADFLEHNYQGRNEKDILLGALEHADNAVRKVSIEQKSNMGAAVAVVIIKDKQLFYTWQGNVRIYVSHHRKLSLLTEDHIAHTGYGRTALTRCIKGAGLREDIPYMCYAISAGDSVYICSDGLYKVAECDLSLLSMDELKSKLVSPEDDASVIQLYIEE